MISMKDYSKQKNISYEAVRKQVVRYKTELEGHIFKRDRTQFLDEYAVDFLDQKRAVNPIVIYEANKVEEIAALREENNTLLRELAAVQKLLLEEQRKLIPLEAKLEIAEKEKQQAILEAVLEANRLSEKAKNDALEEKAKELYKQAEIEKNEAIVIAEKAKDKEFEPVRKELEDKLNELQKELERPVGFIEWLKCKGKKSIK